MWAERRIFNVKPGGTYNNHWALIVHTARHCHLMSKTEMSALQFTHCSPISLIIYRLFNLPCCPLTDTVTHSVQTVCELCWALSLGCVNLSMCEANNHHLVPMIGICRSVLPFIHLHVVGRNEVQKATFCVYI